MSERAFGMALGAIFCAFFFAFLFALGGCASVQTPAPCDQAPQFASWSPSNAPKRKIAFNKREFRREGFNAASFNTFAAKMGLKSVRGLEGINGFTYDADASVALSKSSQVSGALGPDWVIQDEYEHHIFETLYRLTPVEVNAGQPTEPRPPCPGTPPPADPGPRPEPPKEQAKSWGVTRVRAIEAKALVDTSKVKVCIVDTGADLNHSQRGNIVGTKDFTGKGTAQDGNGHGTHTAGTVAGGGGVGVSRSALYICKGLDDRGAGSSQALAQCLNWCGTQGAQVVSNSWGSSQSDPLINQAIKNLTDRGVYVFVAAGNDSGPVNWPAKLAGSNQLVYAVASSTRQDQISDFSSRGPEIRYISPGSGITSNWPGGGTKSLDGTSMATPHAAGICAYGVATGKRPCIKAPSGVAGYPFADALSTVQ